MCAVCCPVLWWWRRGGFRGEKRQSTSRAVDRWRVAEASPTVREIRTGAISPIVLPPCGCFNWGERAARFGKAYGTERSSSDAKKGALTHKGCLHPYISTKSSTVGSPTSRAAVGTVSWRAWDRSPGSRMRRLVVSGLEWVGAAGFCAGRARGRSHTRAASFVIAKGGVRQTRWRPRPLPYCAALKEAAGSPHRPCSERSRDGSQRHHRAGCVPCVVVATRASHCGGWYLDGHPPPPPFFSFFSWGAPRHELRHIHLEAAAQIYIAHSAALSSWKP